MNLLTSFDKNLMPPRGTKNTKTRKSVADRAANLKTQKQSRDKKNRTVTLSLRLPIPMLEEIDKAVKSRPYKMPRHTWLLEAVHEKLSRIPNPRSAHRGALLD